MALLLRVSGARADAWRLRGEYYAPAFAGIVRGESWRCLGRTFAEILFIDHAIFADNEGHDSRIPVPGRPGYDRKSSGQLAVCHVVPGAAFGRGSLLSKHLVEVAIEGLRLIGVGVAESFGEFCQRTQRTGRLALRHWPVQA